MDAMTNWMQRRQSRRGFLAICGKATVALGLAMAGADRFVLTAHAACCPNVPCTGCNFGGGFTCGAPIDGVCPAFCNPASGPVLCCDVGTNTCHACYTCKCLGAPCSCECDTGLECAGNC